MHHLSTRQVLDPPLQRQRRYWPIDELRNSRSLSLGRMIQVGLRSRKTVGRSAKDRSDSMSHLVTGLEVVASQIWCESRLTKVPRGSFYAAGETGRGPPVDRAQSRRGRSSSIGAGWKSSWRSSASKRMHGIVWLTPGQPRLARSSTAHTRLRHDRSPGSHASSHRRCAR